MAVRLHRYGKKFDSNVHALRRVAKTGKLGTTKRSYNTILKRLMIEENEILGKQILDIGSGGSDFLQKCNTLPNTKATGVDLLESIRDIKLIVKRDVLKHTVAGDAVALPFRDNSFGICTSYFTRYYLLKHGGQPLLRIVTAEALRVLKPKGKFIMDWMGMERHADFIPWLEQNGFTCRVRDFHGSPQSLEITKTGNLKKLVQTM